MPVASNVVSSMHFYLNDNRLIDGAIVHRSKRAVAHTPQQAWEQLLKKGKVYLRTLGSNVAELKKLHAAWVEAATMMNAGTHNYMSVYSESDRVVVFLGDGKEIVLGNCLVEDIAIDRMDDGNMRMTLTAVAGRSDIAFRGDAVLAA